MQTIIITGGKGTRYDLERPKALARVGDVPIIRHVMEIYHRQGHSDFILAVGWKQKEIIAYFDDIDHDYNIVFVDTGEDTNTGERLKLAGEMLPDKDSIFYCTYSDGLAAIDLTALEVRHITGNNVATLTAVRPNHQYGILNIDDRNKVVSFNEKPRMAEYINGGFFIFDKKIFKYIKQGDILETDVFQRLVPGKLGAYKHEGYWDTLNTPKDELRLNELFAQRVKEKATLDWLM